MGNPVIGHIECPLCNNDKATVHREGRGKKAMYYRCYDGPNGTCGTIQCRGPGGQDWITRNIRALEPEKKEAIADKAAEEARGEAKAAAREVERKQQQPPPKNAGGLSGIVAGALNIMGAEE